MRTLCLLVLAGSMTAADFPRDEVHALVEEVGPPARFADHVPEFTVESRDYTFLHKGDREVTWGFYVIKDGDRHVALIPRPGFHSGTIYVLDFNPETAPTEIDVPSERWHIDTSIGSELPTGAFVPDGVNADESTYTFENHGDRLVLRRTFDGEGSFNRWAHRDKKEQRLVVDNRFELSCDPIHGYVVEGTYDVRAERIPAKFEFASMATSGRYSLWPGTETVYRAVSCPVGSKGYQGYYLNLAAIAQAGGSQSCRDGGFAGYLNDRSGWSPVLTTSGHEAKLVVCNVHADLDFVSGLGQIEPGDEGLRHVVHHHRLLALPPEITKEVWGEMEVMHADKRKVQIRIGVLEDFEEQPLPYTTRVRGLTWSKESGGPALADEGHSGERSMIVRGHAWPNVPQLVLEPSTDYRMEAWIKIRPFSDEEIAGARAAAEAKHRERVAKYEEKRAKYEEKLAVYEEKVAAGEKPKKEPRPPYDPGGFTFDATPAAWISGHLYEWTPHNAERTRRQTTTKATAPDEWQRVHLDFTSDAWGPFIDVRFHAHLCEALVDDFLLIERSKLAGD